MFRDALFRLRALFRRNTVETELDDELRFHFEHQVEKYVASGMTRQEAMRQARLEFGGHDQVKEACRDARGTALLESLMQDLRYALRTLRKSPGFTAVAVLTLALGIGINTATFSFFYSMVLRPLPVKDPGSIVNAYRTVQNESRFGSFSFPEFEYLRGHNTVFSDLTAFSGAQMTLGGSGGTGETLRAMLVSGNYFSLLGENAAVGRTFLPEEDQTPGSHPVAVLSFDFWQRRFGGDPNLLGKTLTLNLVPYTVVGVTPKGFGGMLPDSPDLWVPLMMQGNAMPGNDYLHDRHASWLRMAGRLHPGIRREQAQAAMTVLVRQFEPPEEQKSHEVSMTLTPGAFLTPGELGDVLPVAVLLMIAVGLILLIACANIANLLLARGAGRQKEIGIRLTLGASRWRVMRQLLTENLLLALAGGAAGLLLSVWAGGLLVPTIHPPGERGFSLNASPDLRVLGYALLVSVLTGLTFGLLPALRSSKHDLVATLKEEGSAFGRRVSQSRLRSALVVSQVAMSLFLLVGAGLLVRAMRKAQTIDLGFEIRNVLEVSADLRLRGYDKMQTRAFERQLVDRLESLPGVKAVGLAERAPLGSSFSDTNFAPEGQEPPPGTSATYVDFNTVSPGYFQALSIPIERGRSFTSEDVAANRHFAVINESLGRRFWPGEDPINKKFERGKWEVIGVAKDARSLHLWAADEPCLYFPDLPETVAPRNMKVFVRTQGNPAALMAALPETARSIDKSIQISVSRLEDNLGKRIWPSQMGALLSGAFGLLALLLASLGIYGVMAYAVSQRIREIGVRMALGARRKDVLSLMLGQGMRLVGLGVAIGLLLSVAGSRLLAKFLFGLSPVDAVTFAAVAVSLAAIALLACYIPARRAMRVDPMVALRYE